MPDRLGLAIAVDRHGDDGNRRVRFRSRDNDPDNFSRVDGIKIDYHYSAGRPSAITMHGTYGSFCAAMCNSDTH